MRARKSLLLLIANLTRSGLGLISMLIVARWMGPAALGTITYLFGLVGLLAIISDLGFSIAHLKRVSEPMADLGACVGTFLSIKVALSLVLLVVITFAPSVGEILGRPIVEGALQRLAYYIIALTPLLNNLSQVALYTFEARQESARQSIVALIGGVATAIARIVVAIWGLGLVALSIAYSLEAMVIFIAAFSLFRGYPISRPRRKVLASYTRYAVPVLAATMLSTVILNVNPVMIERLWDVTEVGYYGGVLGIATLLGRFSSAAMVVFFPQASEEFSLGRPNEVRRQISVIERHLLNLTAPLAILIAYFSPQIVLWLLGPEFLRAAPVLAVLTIDAVVTMFFQPYGMAVYAMGKPQYMVVSSLIQLAVLLLGGVVLISRNMGGLGALGAAIAMIIADILSGLYQVYLTSRFAQIGLYKKWPAYAIAGIFTYGLLKIAGPVTGKLLPGGVALVMLVLGGLGIWALCLSLFGQLRRGDWLLYLDLIKPMKMWRYIRTELAGNSEPSP